MRLSLCTLGRLLCSPKNAPRAKGCACPAAHITLCPQPPHPAIPAPILCSLIPPSSQILGSPGPSRKELWALPCTVPSTAQQGTCCARARPAGPVRPAAGGPDDYYPLLPSSNQVNTWYKSPWAEEATLGRATAKDERSKGEK